MATLPRSCKGAANMISSTWSGGKWSSRAIRALKRPTRLVCLPVASSLTSATRPRSSRVSNWARLSSPVRSRHQLFKKIPGLLKS